MARLFIIIFALVATNILADELVRIQAISKSKRTFITRNAKDAYAQEGTMVAFITDELSFVARAKVVTREYVQWEVHLPGLKLPFVVNDELIISKNTERVLTKKVEDSFSVAGEQNDQNLLFASNENGYFENKQQALDEHLTHASDPQVTHHKWDDYVKEQNTLEFKARLKRIEAERSKKAKLKSEAALVDLNKLKEEIAKKERPHFFFYRFGSSSSKTLSISGVDQTSIQSKGGFQELSYYYRLASIVSLGGGYRSDVEVYNDDLGYRVTRTLTFVQVGLHHQIDDRFELYGLFAAGSGKSKGENSAVVQNGKASLFPSVKVGFNWGITESLRLNLQAGLDSLQTSDTLPDGTSQLTNQVNTNYSFGLGFAM